MKTNKKEKPVAESKQPEAAKVVKMKESREQVLVRLADARVNKACKYISLIGNLAAYKPSPEQVEAIMTALGQACASVQNRMEGIKRDAFTFTLVK